MVYFPQTISYPCAFNSAASTTLNKNYPNSHRQRSPLHRLGRHIFIMNANTCVSNNSPFRKSCLLRSNKTPRITQHAMHDSC